MPANGFVISVPRSETIDLNITVDQAIQFCVSCGVVVPEHQRPRTIDGGVRAADPDIRLADGEAPDQDPGPGAPKDTDAADPQL